MNKNMRKMYSEQDIADIVEKVLSKGVDKVNPQALIGLTHSVSELDETLRDIIDNSNSGVACTQAQWNVIKALFDKSLFLVYNGFIMTKIMTDGIGKYLFGGVDTSSDQQCGCSFAFNYDASTHVLYGAYTEL